MNFQLPLDVHTLAKTAASQRRQKLNEFAIQAISDAAKAHFASLGNDGEEQPFNCGPVTVST